MAITAQKYKVLKLVVEMLEHDAFRARERYAYLCRHHPELKQAAAVELEMLKQEMTEHDSYEFWLGCCTPHEVPVGYVP